MTLAERLKGAINANWELDLAKARWNKGARGTDAAVLKIVIVIVIVIEN